MTSKITLNPEQKLYVIKTTGGYTCWGFDNCFNEVQALAERLNQPAPKPEDYGTIALYDRHIEQIKYVRQNRIELGTWFDPKTPKEVRDVLEAMRLAKLRVRIYYGDTDTGKSWLDEHDMIGRVGRSTGTMKIPILVADGDDGGCGILTASIIRIQGASSLKDLYRHPKFHVPEMAIYDGLMEDLPWEVHVDNKVHARFKTDTKAQNYIEFMNGERMKP